MENNVNFAIMSSDPEPDVKGILVKNQTLVTDKNLQKTLEQKGYGEVDQKKFFLKPFESLYLLYCNKLILKKGNKKINFDSMMEICNKFDSSALTKFLIYRDLKTRGYIVKDGFGFGSDFRVYERGDFGQKGAKFLIFGFNEGTQEKMGVMQKKIEQITQMGKEPIIAVIERRGEVIYYKVSRMNFLQNKANLDQDLL